MKRISIILSTIAVSLFASSCKEELPRIPELDPATKELILTDKCLSTDFVGNGAQWGGYESISTWLGGDNDLSEADWNKLFERVDYLRPPFIRLMVNKGSYMDGDTFVADKNVPLLKILDYCQRNGIEVTFGEWGHEYSGDTGTIDKAWLTNSVKYLAYLVQERGFTCIKTLNIVNEPNGEWSTTKGDYSLWKNIQTAYLAECQANNINIPLMGPDVAVFEGTNELSWFSNTAKDLNDKVGLYDLHVYPKQLIVRNGDYTEMLKSYKAVLPADKRVVLGEVGFKYTEVDADLKARNEAAIEADPFAGEDSNMMVYEGFYGIDMADALIQSMMAGYSGGLIWMMDDAMYIDPVGSDYTVKKLKRWGFWNSLGAELCNDESDEDIRPYFYTSSLLCRYFPAGSDIYEVKLPNKKGLRAIMAKKDGKYSIAIVNSHYTTYDITLKSDHVGSLTADLYTYQSNADGSFTGKVDAKGLATPSQSGANYNFSAGVDMKIEGESFILITNIQ